MKTAYEHIVDEEHVASWDSRENITDILSLAKEERLTPAAQDEKRTLLLAIDVQNDFMEDIGSLAVSGSRGDVQRLTRWMYRNIGALTQVICSLDCHQMLQIFHPAWWLDANNLHPAPFTIIRYEDVVNGTWRVANGAFEQSLEYLRQLDAGGRKELCVWPYHCLEGTMGAKLESEFTKMLYFHSAVRKTAPQLIYKGQNPFTEMYGIIKAEYDPDNFVNQAVLDAIMEYDAIFIAGQASSHCVLASTEQVLAYFGTNRNITSRITLLEDCMSPIAGFGEETNRAFETFKSQYGVRIQRSTAVTL